ncbi:iron ABC transporter permease [Gordonia sp. L191]|uniref:FecCD family ABC transporter permease n=1 Tax=Gordonia sp. L191 TaxID=2982699 RepID=UPI0024BF34B2|nr:iron ABC transporter permease [Gordonia sp. L191]WHU46371.1 iron ABC transporter permease [Gordonia sp. L191]
MTATAAVPPSTPPSTTTATRRRVLTVSVAVVLMLVGAVLSMWIGTRWTDPAQVIDALTAGRGHGGDIGIIVWDQRIPRTLMAIAVGAAIALSGALVQGLTGNPLGDPGVLGISGGAAFFSVLAVFLFGLQSVSAYVWFAVAGAIIAAALVFGVASLGGGGANPLSLILAGAACSAFFIAGTTAVILNDQASLNQYRFWSAGSLVERDLGILAGVAPLMIVGVVVALACGPSLNVLAAGPELATALGVRVGMIRGACFLALTLLAAAGTAAAGPIAFLGLVVPHIVRHFTGPDHRWLLVACMPAGAALMLVADVIGRVVMRPAEVQVGVILAFIGVPVYIYLVRRRMVQT